MRQVPNKKIGNSYYSPGFSTRAHFSRIFHGKTDWEQVGPQLNSSALENFAFLLNLCEIQGFRGSMSGNRRRLKWQMSLRYTKLAGFSNFLQKKTSERLSDVNQKL